MAVQVDYLQTLVDRNDVYDPYATLPGPELPPLPFGAVQLPFRARRPLLRLESTRVLAASCLISWSIVAVETWMLVR